MRKMKNLDSRMAATSAYRIENPAEHKGLWRELKKDCAALWVEVGCGKGKFTAETAQANPDVLLIAVERCREAMVVAMALGASVQPLTKITPSVSTTAMNSRGFWVIWPQKPKNDVSI